MKKLKKFLYDVWLTWRYTAGNIKHYHSGKLKGKAHILRELIGWQLKEHDFNRMYYAWGLNLAGTVSTEYIGRKEFLELKSKVEQKLKKRNDAGNFNFDVITKDKFYANSIFLANDIPCIQNKAVLSGSNLILPGGQRDCLERILGFEGVFFLKNTLLEAGDGVFQCFIREGKIHLNGKPVTFDDFRIKLKTGIWVIQDQHFSHHDIRKVNATALNTTRIVTILNGEHPEYLAGFQAFATGNSTTDSWSGNSIYTGIDIENECLTGDGYCNLDEKNAGLVSEHPDSRIQFKGYKIPFLKDAVNLCLHAHNLLFYNFVVGWDVAITETGPVIVEANEKPGMNVIQCIHGGLRSQIVQYSGRYLP